MTSQNPNYHYNKAREALRKADNAEGIELTKQLELSRAHMEMYAQLKDEQRKDQETWQKNPYTNPGQGWRYSPTPWTQTYGTTTTNGIIGDAREASSNAGLDQS